MQGTCVVHEHNLLGVEQLLGNEEGPDDVICHTACKRRSLPVLAACIALLTGCMPCSPGTCHWAEPLLIGNLM